MRVILMFTLGFTLSLGLMLWEGNPFLVLLTATTLFTLAFHFCRLGPLKPCLLVIGVGGIFACAYLFCYHAIFYESVAEYYGETIFLQGEIVEFPEETLYGYSAMIEANLEGKKVLTQIYLDNQAENLRVGDKISVSALLYAPDESFSGEPTRYYQGMGVQLRGVAKGDLTVEQWVDFPWRFAPDYLALWLKGNFQTYFSQEDSGVLIALCLGDKSGLSDSLSNAVERAGLAHVVAVSGMHLSFLVGMIRVMVPSGKKYTAFLVIFTGVLFFLVTGASLSTARALIMLILLYLAPFFRRGRDDFTALSLALLVILLVNPYSVCHVGLQFSVCSVAGILLFAEVWTTKMMHFFKLSYKKKGFFFGKFACSVVSVTLSATLITVPLTAMYFSTVSLVAPLANLCCLWVVTYLFAAAFIFGVFSGIFPVVAPFLALFLLPFLDFFFFMVPMLGNQVFSAVTTDSFYYQSWLIFVYAVLVWCLFYGKSPKKIDNYWISPCCAVVITFCVVAILHSESRFAHAMTIEVLDVGQGQCVIVTMGDYTVMADCGGSAFLDVGDLAAKYLEGLGRNHLDFLVLSHVHRDHAEGVLTLLDRVSVDCIAMPDYDSELSLKDEIISKALANGSDLWMIESETSVDLGESGEIRLFPSPNLSSENEAGITLLLTCGEDDFLLTGDISGTTEMMLLELYDFPDIELLMVGHHGSRFSTSSLLLDTLSPEIALISVGKGNSYGHPTDEVLIKLEERGIYTYRSDITGNLGFYIPKGG